MFSGRSILFFFAHLNKRIRLIKTVGSGAVIHHLACAFYLQERKYHVFCTFQLASNFRAVSAIASVWGKKKTSYLLYLVRLVSSGEILHLLARPKSEWDWIWKCQVLQTSSFCWCCGTWQHGEKGHIPQRNKHSHIQSPTHKSRLAHILFS